MSSKARDLAKGRRAKIICTLGPSSDSEETIGAMLRAGMDVARLNLSYEQPELHAQRIERVRRLGKSRRPVAIMVDLPGRKVRLGKLSEPQLELTAGQEVLFVPNEGQAGDARALPVDQSFFHDNMIRGDRVLLSNQAELEVVKLSENQVLCKALYNGLVRPFAGVHAEGMPLPKKLLTETDLSLMKLAIEQEVDYLGLTYISDDGDIIAAREKLYDLGGSIPLIAKVERSEAFARLDGILRRADGVMLRRGDLSAQIESTRVPLVQKKILRLANNAGVPAVIATQMLGSMVSAPRPTRAEASDVSNAIAEGADGVMLSSETAIGKFPVRAVEMMNRIIKETESEGVELLRNRQTERMNFAFTDTTARIACQAAEQTEARLLVCFTESGLTAKLVAKYRPQVPVIAFCSSQRTRRRLALHWGIRSDKLEVGSDADTMVKSVESRLLDRGLVSRGDRLVIVYGAPVGMKGNTNSLRLHEVGR